MKNVKFAFKFLWEVVKHPKTRIIIEKMNVYRDLKVKDVYYNKYKRAIILEVK